MKFKFFGSLSILAMVLFSGCSDYQEELKVSNMEFENYKMDKFNFEPIDIPIKIIRNLDKQLTYNSQTKINQKVIKEYESTFNVSKINNAYFYEGLTDYKIGNSNQRRTELTAWEIPNYGFIQNAMTFDDLFLLNDKTIKSNSSIVSKDAYNNSITFTVKGYVVKNDTKYIYIEFDKFKASINLNSNVVSKGYILYDANTYLPVLMKAINKVEHDKSYNKYSSKKSYITYSSINLVKEKTLKTKNFINQSNKFVGTIDLTKCEGFSSQKNVEMIIQDDKSFGYSSDSEIEIYGLKAFNRKSFTYLVIKNNNQNNLTIIVPKVFINGQRFNNTISLNNSNNIRIEWLKKMNIATGLIHKCEGSINLNRI